jgi:hypothetical protein
MKLKSILQTTAAAAFIFGSVSAAFAQEAAPEDRSSSTMDRDGGPTGLNPKLYETRTPPYVNSPYASSKAANESGPYSEYQSK